MHRLKLIAKALAAAALAATLGNAHAFAGSWDQPEPAPVDTATTLGSGVIGVSVTVGGSGGGGSGGGNSGCRWVQTAPESWEGDDNEGEKTINGITYRHYTNYCPAKGTSANYWVPVTSSVRSATPQLRQAVYERLPSPTFGSAPPASSNIAKYDMWMWADPGEFLPVSATATVLTGGGGVSASVTATPLRLVFDPGEPDSSPVVCAWPGQAWTAADGDDDSACMYAYYHSSSIDPSGTFAASWSIVWDVTWSSSNGTGGVVNDSYLTTTAVAMTVKEVQVLVSG